MMEQEELAILKLVSLCREDHSLHHPGLGGRKEVAACIAGRSRARWATMSEREKAPFLDMVSGSRVSKPMASGKKILMSGGKIVKAEEILKLFAPGKKEKSIRKKRRFSGYLIYRKEMIGEVKAELHGAYVPGDHPARKLMIEVGRRWALLPPEAKARYQSLAEGFKREAKLAKEEVKEVTAAGKETFSGEAVKLKRKKKNLSGFMIFSRENKNMVLQELLAHAQGETLSNSIILKEVGKRWDILPTQVRTCLKSKV